MKHYMDIENLRETDETIKDLFRKANCSCFEVGDHIQITEKYDGSNASIRIVNGNLHCFSRKMDLTPEVTLNGFYDYIQKKVSEGLSIPSDLVVFGEWSGNKNKIVYEKKNEWFVFDIFDAISEQYWPQEKVKAFCLEHRLEYIHELYNGPFISWQHCRSFLNSPYYGNRQEGIVIKNQDKLEMSEGYFYLKIVNDDFKETVKAPKQIDYEKLEAQAQSKALMEQVVTYNRVTKILSKLQDENKLSKRLDVRDLTTIAKILPRTVFEDCMKEEPEIVIAAGEYAGKNCSTITMQIVRNLIHE